MIAMAPVQTRHRRSAFISAVLPVYNEAAILRELTRQLVAVLEAQSAVYEIVYVNDGSADGSGELLDQLSAENHRIVVVQFRASGCSSRRSSAGSR